VDVHWYTPERAPSQTGIAERQGGGCEVRVGRVTSGIDLGLRIAHGDGLYEIGYYDGLRWTERPEQYVRRAVGRALFEEGPFRRAMTDTAPTLSVEVIDFEEVKAPATHAARLALRVVLSTDRVLLERTVMVSKSVADYRFDSFVASMAEALTEAADEIARDVDDTCCSGAVDACRSRSSP